jgi:hypothetical protein
MACRFYALDNTAQRTLMSLGKSSDNLHNFHLVAGGATTGDPVEAQTRDSGATASTAFTSTGFSTNTWHSAAAVYASTSSRAAYIDGGSKGTNTATRTPTSLNRFGIGILARSDFVGNLNGYIAGAAVWDVALTDEEIASHAMGFSPLKIRPQSLVFYAPLVRGVQDVRAARTITMTGTVAVQDHPRGYGI